MRTASDPYRTLIGSRPSFAPTKLLAGTAMTDLIYLALGVAIFVAFIGYAALLKRA
jgi:hypothetical protein